MIIEHDIFGLTLKQQRPQRGGLIVAEPFLNEPFFSRAVILLIDETDNGPTMGLVLNHKTDFSLQEAIPSIDIDEEIPLYCGGPMSNDRLFFIHTLGDIIPKSEKIKDGVYINGDFNVLLDYINNGGKIDGNIRFFLGYSGWDKEQLDTEIEAHTWAVSPMTKDFSFYLQNSGNRYWQSVVKEMGEKYRPWLNCPTKPSNN